MTRPSKRAWLVTGGDFKSVWHVRMVLGILCLVLAAWFLAQPIITSR